MNDVPKALRRQEPCLGAVVLEHAVRRDRRAVEDGVDVRRLEASLCTELRETHRRRQLGVLGSRPDLVDADGARLRVVEHEVRKGAADIDADDVHGG